MNIVCVFREGEAPAEPVRSIRLPTSTAQQELRPPELVCQRQQRAPSRASEDAVLSMSLHSDNRFNLRSRIPANLVIASSA